MNKLVYFLFLCIFSLDYLAFKLNLISDKVALIPDVLSIIAVVFVVGLASSSKAAIDKKWILFFSVFIIYLLIGVILNTVPPGPMIVGFRSYLKYLPFFLLPVVFAFDDKQVGRQMKLLLLLALVQSPLSVVQKFLQFGVASSGDYVSGTLSSGGQLPILMASALAIVTAFYLRNHISTKIYVILLIALIIPTTLAESKASIGYLPLAFILPMMFNGGAAGQKKISAKTIGVIVMFMVTALVFVLVYDHFAQFGRQSRQAGLMEFFTSGDATEYLNRGAVDASRITKLGYIDILLLPLDKLSDEPLHLMFGLGIGNLQGSAIGSLSGEYVKQYGQYGAKGSAMALFLWEIGILGGLLYCLFIYMVFQDARHLSRARGLDGVIGLGMTGVMGIAFVSLFFRNPFLDLANGYLFWYLSGYVVAARNRQRFSRQEEAGAVTIEQTEKEPAGERRILSYKKTDA